MAGGRCLCGHHTYHTHGQPKWVAHCHCESCRRQTGSIPATFVGFAADQVHYNAAPFEFESSPGIFRGFCSRCGSALHYRPAADDEIHLYLGSLDNPGAYQAQRHVFYNEHIDGYEMYDDLPRFGEHSGQTPMAWGPLSGKQPD